MLLIVGACRPDPLPPDVTDLTAACADDALCFLVSSEAVGFSPVCNWDGTCHAEWRWIRHAGSDLAIVFGFGEAIDSDRTVATLQAELGAGGTHVDFTEEPTAPPDLHLCGMGPFDTTFFSHEEAQLTGHIAGTLRLCETGGDIAHTRKEIDLTVDFDLPVDFDSPPTTDVW